MKIFYAVEANTIIEEVPEFRALIHSDTNVYDHYNSIFIYETEIDAYETELLLSEADLYENHYELVQTIPGLKEETFNDFGITTSTSDYLIKDLICAFSIISGASKAIQMAEFQLQEHLIYKGINDDDFIYFVEHHLKKLIYGIANAYDIEVSFFELDKQRKKL